MYANSLKKIVLGNLLIWNERAIFKVALWDWRILVSTCTLCHNYKLMVGYK